MSEPTRGHQSHTTLPDSTTITTENGARLTIENYTRCVVQVVNRSTGSDGIEHEEVSEGHFIVLAHGLDYADRQPRAVWLELSPIVDVTDPAARNGGWLDGHHDSLVNRTPAPAGWVEKPGADTLDREHAETAIAALRTLIDDGVLWCGINDMWHWTNGHGDSEPVQSAGLRDLLTELHT